MKNSDPHLSIAFGGDIYKQTDLITIPSPLPLGCEANFIRIPDKDTATFMKKNFASVETHK